MQFHTVIVTAATLFGSIDAIAMPISAPIALLFSEPYFNGTAVTITGSFANCHDVPASIQKTAKSVKFTYPTKSCILYDAKGCGAATKKVTVNNNVTIEYAKLVMSIECSL